jgi:hypothetical protein
MCEWMDCEMHGGAIEYYCLLDDHMEAHYILNFSLFCNLFYTVTAAPAVTLQYFAVACRCVAWLLAICSRTLLNFSIFFQFFSLLIIFFTIF